MRISRPHMFMQMAEVAAMRSTCFRGNVGALIVSKNDIVCMGYNGPPSGEDHCHGNSCARSHTGGCLRSVHAERNAIQRATQKLKSHLQWCDIYCTYSPCPECAALVVNSCLSRFFYRYSYRLSEGLELMLKNNVEVYRITSAGYILDEKSGQIIDPVNLRS